MNLYACICVCVASANTQRDSTRTMLSQESGSVRKRVYRRVHRGVKRKKNSTNRFPRSLNLCCIINVNVITPRILLSGRRRNLQHSFFFTAPSLVFSDALFSKTLRIRARTGLSHISQGCGIR